MSDHVKEEEEQVAKTEEEEQVMKTEEEEEQVAKSEEEKEHVAKTKEDQEPTGKNETEYNDLHPRKLPRPRRSFKSQFQHKLKLEEDNKKNTNEETLRDTISVTLKDTVKVLENLKNDSHFKASFRTEKVQLSKEDIEHPNPSSDQSSSTGLPLFLSDDVSVDDDVTSSMTIPMVSLINTSSIGGRHRTPSDNTTPGDFSLEYDSRSIEMASAESVDANEQLGASSSLNSELTSSEITSLDSDIYPNTESTTAEDNIFEIKTDDDV